MLNGVIGSNTYVVSKEMSTVRLQRIGQKYRKNVIGPLTASLLSKMNEENQHLRTSYVPVMHCEKMAVIDMSLHQRAVIEFLVRETLQQLSTSDFVMCMEMSAWYQQCQKVGETF
jgi:hypothetical protein